MNFMLLFNLTQTLLFNGIILYSVLEYGITSLILLQAITVQMVQIRMPFKTVKPLRVTIDDNM